MKDFYILAIFVAVFMAILGGLFVTGAICAKKEGRYVKCGIAVLCGMIALGETIFLLCYGQLSLDDIFGGAFLTIPLSWVAMCYVSGFLKQLAVFMVPAIPVTVVFFIDMLTLFGHEFPVDESEVDYTTQEEVETLLGVDSLPKLKFEGAANSSAGVKVWLKLENPADSTQLDSAFKQLCETHPLQHYKGSLYLGQRYEMGGMYQIVNNNDEQYVNVTWGNEGIFIIYGNICPKEANNDHFFDSIDAPMPKYEYIGFLAVQYGPDWYQEQRVRFAEPVSWSWLSKVKVASVMDSTIWNYRDEKDVIYIDFNNRRYGMHIKLYKNMEGERRIADIEWGDY